MRMSWPVEWQSFLGDARLVVVLVRHGETLWNRERRFLGVTDLELDDHGRKQARTLGDWLQNRLDRVYCSPLRRAHETALCRDATPIPDRAWMEMHQGELEGLSREQAVERFPTLVASWLQNPVEISAPGGETLRACRDRAWAALERLVAVHPTGIIGVVSHQMVISSLTCTACGDALPNWRAHALPNAACTVLVREEGRFRVAIHAFRPPEVIALESSR